MTGVSASAAIKHEFDAHRSLFEAFEAECSPIIERIARLLVDTYRADGRLLICGCGGSAADSQHIAAEFLNRFRFPRPALPAIALSTDSSVLTSIANDDSFENAFARQVEGLGRPGDALLAISTSGRSAVVLRALQVARRLGLSTLGLTGGDPTAMQPSCDLLLSVPSSNTARIQECHQFAYHTICALVEQAMFGEETQNET